jgi:hypothetical protein
LPDVSEEEPAEMAARTAAGEMPAPETRNGVLGYFIGGRFIPRMAGGETPPNPGEGDPPKGDEPPTGKDGKPFDAERAQRTIDQLREEVKTGKATAAKLAAAEAKLREIEDANKSETERATARAAEEEQKRIAAEQRAADLVLRLTVERTATKLGFHDPDDAYRLIDRKAVEMDDEGEPTNVEALLKDLAKAKPHLVKADDTKKAERGTPGTPKPNGKAPTGAEKTQEEVNRLRATGRYSV